MTKFHFDFINNYDGVSDYRLHEDGRPFGTRYKVETATRRCFYNDLSSAVTDNQLAAFNAMQLAQHEKAKAKYPEEVGIFVPYIA